MYIARNQYLERLKSARTNGLIKIVTGLRRCGKSYLLFKIFRKFRLEDGVKEDHIIGIAWMILIMRLFVKFGSNRENSLVIA